MSVINKMLRDLEQRRSVGSSSGDVIRQQKQPVWLTVLLWLTLLLSAFAIYAVLSRNTATVILPVTEPIAATEPALKAVTSTAVASAAATVAAPPPAIAAPALPVTRLPESALQRAEPSDQSAAPAAGKYETPPVIARQSTQQSASQPAPQSALPQITSRPADTAPLPLAVANTEQVVSHLSITPSAPSAGQRAATLRQQALLATQAGQWLQAVGYWQQLQQQTPQQAQPYVAQARLWLQLGDPQQAELTLKQAMTQNVQDADIQLLLAQAAASRQQWQQVDELLAGNYAATQHPQYAQYYGLKATALQQLAQHQQALLWFDRLSQLQPQQAKWWLGGAISLDALARPAEAKQYFRNALQWGDSLSQQSKAYIQQRLTAAE